MKLETSEEDRERFKPGATWFTARLLRDIDTLLAEVERLRATPPAPPLPAEVEEMRGRILVALLHAAIRASNDEDHETAAYFDSVRDDAASLLSRWPGGWRPIETAPKMKTIMLFAVTDRGEDGLVKNWKMATGFWHNGFADHHDMSPWEWNGRQLAKYDVQPTHWMPIPEPPNE